jgi:cytochrome c5
VKITSALLIAIIALPIASVVVAADKNERAARTKKLYDSYCFVCHGTGWQGAPMTGNKDDWQARMDNGWDAVLKNARVGLNAMPAKGTCEECNEEDFRELVTMMLIEQ